MSLNHFELQEEVYNKMLLYLDELLNLETIGSQKDVQFIHQDFWLQNTAVIENIEIINGEWNIFLLFADHLAPLKFLKRKIIQYSSFKKAVFNAQYMRRQAAKDQRGTIIIDIKYFKLNFS
ncbi:hypothetical protein [Sediminibacterium sp.]|uniref:hypothetical protein n=1 Tax=Sediminibacterium sp. TaxID=1917865 RepID=UPI001E0A8744|nr:hypothetical protein [Sediminibacterium sp.]MBU0697799.1 hypothetical protein [Bacteroidota bacterium]MBU1372966.1 hypothetical protein [Bacteroidota bacterium]MBU1483897.1 hypothetical protein [Bacteroidota bacterium]MBU1759755.1 hypothetical protein [Bacteroidota bacterium]MBU2267420.1 hypothetical protein [Bacteroidota bacterium]